MCVKSDGTAWSFGFGLHGQLGHGDTADQLSPKAITALSNNVVECSAGDRCGVMLAQSVLLQEGMCDFAVTPLNRLDVLK